MAHLPYSSRRRNTTSAITFLRTYSRTPIAPPPRREDKKQQKQQKKHHNPPLPKQQGSGVKGHVFTVHTKHI